MDWEESCYDQYEHDLVFGEMNAVTVSGRREHVFVRYQKAKIHECAFLMVVHSLFVHCKSSLHEINDIVSK